MVDNSTTEEHTVSHKSTPLKLSSLQQSDHTNCFKDSSENQYNF